MRLLKGHQVAGAETTLMVGVTDLPGSGNANHRYVIGGFDATTNTSFEINDHIKHLAIIFQNGTIDKGVNGVTQEALLEVCADRLRSFQAGPFASEDNAEALEHIELAIKALHRRTERRVARGVEGKEIV